MNKCANFFANAGNKCHPCSLHSLKRKSLQQHLPFKFYPLSFYSFREIEDSDIGNMQTTFCFFYIQTVGYII